MISKGFVVAAPASGSGKTTVALGLMAALARRGLVVQPFKCGPDFIDPGHHTRVCGGARASRNLDSWMLPADVNRAIFQRHASTADISIVEGVMGLFDGARNSTGSTADLARTLGLPIILVVDAAKMAASAAAMVHGFATFDPSVRVAGVIFNQVGSANHYALLCDAMTRVSDVALLGYLPRDTRLRMPERYLGLVTAGEETLSDEDVAHLADVVERHVDVDRLLDLAMIASDDAAGDKPAPTPIAPRARARARIGVARDRAFCFYYEDNLDALRAAGAELITFSPLQDTQLPANLDALYFGGGYPELSAEVLSGNQAMRTAVLDFIDRGGHVYAECGGLMYLAETLETRDGRRWPMLGALPLTIVMTDRSQRFGYVEVTLARDTLLGPAGTIARGHSFHYSQLASAGEGPCAADAVPRAYDLRYSLSGRTEAEGFTSGRVLASYVHIHFLSNPAIAASFVQRVASHSPRAD